MNTSVQLRETILRENKRVHAREASSYERIHSEIYNWYEQRSTWRRIRTIERLIGAKPTRTALDVGCGTGNVLLKLSSLGFDVTGLDLSRNMLAVVAQKGYPAHKLVCSDVDSFLNRNKGLKFDVVAFSSVLHHLPDYLGSLLESIHLLDSGGVLFITHEPLKQSDSARSGFPLAPWLMVHKLAWLAYAVRRCWSRARLGAVDYTLSDYHAQDGIPVQDIVDALSAQGLNVLEVERYVTEKTGWASFLNNGVLDREPESFALIAQKR